jgi:hypothetical protein
MIFLIPARLANLEDDLSSAGLERSARSFEDHKREHTSVAASWQPKPKVWPGPPVPLGLEDLSQLLGEIVDDICFQGSDL